MPSTQYKAIDLFKFCAAILILLLHVPPFSAGTAAYVALREVIGVVAVPFFFAASGFFAASRLSAPGTNALQAAWRPYRMYLIWALIYLPFTAFGWLTSSLPLSQSIGLWVRDFFLEGSYLTIWFLNALALSTLLYTLLLRRLSPRTCLFATIPLFFVACLLSSYNGLLIRLTPGAWISNAYYTIFSSTKNGLLFGLPFVALGGYLRTARPCKRPRFAALGALCCFALLVLEVILRHRLFPGAKSVDFALSLLPLTYFLLLLAYSLELRERTWRGESLYPLLRKLSTLVFLTQRLFIFGFEMLDKLLKLKLGKYVISTMPPLHFLLVALCTLAFSILLYRASQKHQCLKKIY